MTTKVALGIAIDKETIDQYANIECVVFGDILLQAMGINGGCVGFRPSKIDGEYLIAWVLDNGEQCGARFDIDTILHSLKGKIMHLTMDVYTRE